MEKLTLFLSFTVILIVSVYFAAPLREGLGAEFRDLRDGVMALVPQPTPPQITQDIEPTLTPKPTPTPRPTPSTVCSPGGLGHPPGSKPVEQTCL